MGFLDKAKAAANDLAAKADTAMAGSGLNTPGAPAGGGDAERYFRDLGVLAYLEESGRPVPPGERERILAALRDLDSRGAVRSFSLHTAPPPAPGAPGAPSSPAAPAGQTVPPPPGSTQPRGEAQSQAHAQSQAPTQSQAHPQSQPAEQSQAQQQAQQQRPGPARDEHASPPPPSWMTQKGQG
ncbi:hypothetical protein [Georgenia halophila]